MYLAPFPTPSGKRLPSCILNTLGLCSPLRAELRQKQLLTVAGGLSLGTEKALEVQPTTPERWAEATGPDRPDAEERKTEGGVGRRRKGYFKAHKITES